MTSPGARERRARLRYSLGPIAIACFCALPIRALLAETDISASQTTPVKTSTAGNIVIDSGGTINPSKGAAVTIDSSNTVNNEGTITINDANNATGILVNGGNTGSVTSSGTITVTDSTLATTIPLTKGTDRYGIWVQGTGAFTGDIDQSGGTIQVRGNNSAGILISTQLVGDVTIAGFVGATGNDTYGLQTLAEVNNITVTGTLYGTGTGASAMYLQGEVNGALDLGGSIRASGYLIDGSVITSRPTDTVLAGINANNVLQSGPAVAVLNSVTGGIVVEASTSVASYSSSAALLIGPTSGSATIGVYDTADYTNGLRIEGTVGSDGIFDKFNATGIQIGGTGGSVTVDGGIDVVSGGAIKATAYAANATALTIDSGATVATITNAGRIAANVIYGANGNAAIGGTATAVMVNGGSVGLIQNTGAIVATTASGRAVALDLRGDTSAVTVTQSSSGTTTAPTITGNILFGDTNSTLNLSAGSIVGAVEFGKGTNALNITNGGILTGNLSAGGDGTSVDVANGRLNLTNLSAVNLASLTIGASGEVNFTVDAANGTNTRLNTVDALIVSPGARIGVDFTSRLTTPETFTLIQTTPASLAGQPAPTVGDVSYFYVGNVMTDKQTGTISLDVSQRSFNGSGIVGTAAAFDAIGNAVYGSDSQLRQAFNLASSKQDFSHLYTQMLPFYAGGLFEILQQGTQAIVSAQDNAPIALAGTHSGAWVQSLGFGATKGSDSADPGYYGGGLGLAFGWETPASPISVLGVSFSYMRGSVTQSGMGTDSSESGTAYTGGVYFRENDGPIRINASVNVGVSQYNSVRNLNAYDATGAAFNRSASSSWIGGLGQAHLSLGYEMPLTDHFYVRPELAGDYFMLYEGSHSEHNGGNAFDLKIASSLGKQGSVEGTVALGAHYDDNAFIWKPELKVGYRQVFGGPDDTMAQFSMNSPFMLSPKAQEGGAVAQIGVHGGDKYTDVAFEAGGEDRGMVRGFNGQLVGRLKF